MANYDKGKPRQQRTACKLCKFGHYGNARLRFTKGRRRRSSRQPAAVRDYLIPQPVPVDDWDEYNDSWEYEYDWYDDDSERFDWFDLSLSQPIINALLSAAQ